MAAVKPDKIREEFYDFVTKALEAQGITPVGRSKEGLVFENHVDGEHVVVKVIKKKNQVAEGDLGPVTTYEEKMAEYETEKAEKAKEKKEEEEEITAEQKDGFKVA